MLEFPRITITWPSVFSRANRSGSNTHSKLFQKCLNIAQFMLQNSLHLYQSSQKFHGIFFIPKTSFPYHWILSWLLCHSLFGWGGFAEYPQSPASLGSHPLTASCICCLFFSAFLALVQCHFSVILTFISMPTHAHGSSNPDMSAFLLF